MHATVGHHRRASLTALLGTALAVMLVPSTATGAPAADPAPEVVASFTQRVQPLVLNHCAAGACHGGARSPEPRFHRGLAGRPPDQAHTRANLHALLDVVGPDRDPRPLAAMLAAGHPPHAATRHRRAAPLSTAERLTLDRWLAEVREVEKRPAIVDPGVVPVSAEVAEPVPPPPNRFREILDNGGPPPVLAPPPLVEPGEQFTSRVDLRTKPAPGSVTPPADPR